MPDSLQTASQVCHPRGRQVFELLEGLVKLLAVAYFLLEEDTIALLPLVPRETEIFEARSGMCICIATR